jgi:hypothetical protein
MTNSPNSVELYLQVPEGMIEERRYEPIDYDWWDDECTTFLEDFTKRTGLWHEGWHVYRHRDRDVQRNNVEFNLNRGAYVYFKCGVSNWEQFFALHDLEDKFPIVLQYFHNGQGSDIAFRTSRYSSGSPTFYIEYDDSNVSWQWNHGVDDATLELMDGWLNAEIKELLEFVEDLIKDEFSTLLKHLQDEYEWICSDDYIRESIQCNNTDEELIAWAVDNDEVHKLTWKSQPATLTEQQANGA